MGTKRPNILLIMSDQQRFDTVSAYGNKTICKTPNIDKLFQEGVRFDNAFTPSAICSPARASLFTGLYPRKHGVWFNEACINKDVDVLTDYMIPAGYECGYSGKWHVDQEKGPSDYGFHGKDFLGYGFLGSGVLPGLKFNQPPEGPDEHYSNYLVENGFDDVKVTNSFMGNNPGNQAQEMYALHDGPVESCIEYFVAEETCKTIDEISDKGKPFFMWANFWGPHSPSLVPEPYYSMYNPEDIPEYPSYCEDFSAKPMSHKLSEKLWGLGDFGWKGFREIAARYLGHCTLLDDMTGKILKHLEDKGLLDNTIIIYTTDHGDCLGAHKLIEKGPFMYDEIYKIPMIVKHPDCIKKGTVNNDFVYLHELMCTFLDIAGVEVPEKLDGQSILPQMLGSDYSNNREEIYCTFDTHFFPVNQRMIRTKTHQFTFNSGDIGELYDLEKDPYQLTNEYDNEEYFEIRKKLMDKMEEYMVELNDPVLRWYRNIRHVY